LSLSRTACAYP